MNELVMYSIHLFAGAGGGILADMLLGHTPIAACEIEEYPRKVLLQRQIDGVLPVFPIWDDINTLRSDNPECSDAFDEWRKINTELVICGGFPCQDVSAAGKGAGITGERSGLWSEFSRIIGEVRPRYCFVENSPLLVSRGLDVILSDLAQMGYNAEWGIIGAWQVGAPHKRDRIWILGHDADAPKDDDTQQGREVDTEWQNEQGREPAVRPKSTGLCEDVPDPDSAQREGVQCASGINTEHAYTGSNSWWETESGFCRVADGVAFRAHRLTAIGNGQVPAVAATAWNILYEQIQRKERS